VIIRYSITRDLKLYKFPVLDSVLLEDSRRKAEVWRKKLEEVMARQWA
jgi:hypothetical protein